MLRLCSLGSGSGGNGLVVEASDGRASTRVLVDNGFNLRQLSRRLERIGLDIAALDAVFVTHEHSDHAAGIRRLALKHGVAVYCTAGTAAACDFDALGVAWIQVQDGVAVDVGALRIEPYAVPHDANEPVQYTFTDGARRAGLLTDAGECSEAILAALAGLHALVLECNHDSAMLRHGAYPLFLKARIGGGLGHLSNDQAADILACVEHPQLAWVAAAHLSAVNNSPELAQIALARALDCSIHEIAIADQHLGLAWRTV